MTKGMASPACCQLPNSSCSSSSNHHQTDENNPGHVGGPYQQQQQSEFEGESTSFDHLKQEADQQQQQFQQATAFGGNRLMPICAQCAQPIVDPFILRLHPDLEFHQACLKCAECQNLLDEHAGSAFLRDEKILCRDDYIRLYSRRCQRCGMQFQPTDLVMRARQLVFHMNCFNCIACHRLLVPGEQFLLRQDELFCRPECFMLFQQPPPPFPQSEFITLQPTQNFQPEKSLNLNGTAAPFELASLRAAGNGPNMGTSQTHSSTSTSSFVRPQPAAQLQQQGCPSAVSSGASPLSFSNPDDSLTPSSTNASTPTAAGTQLANSLAGHFGASGGAFHGGTAPFESAMAGGGQGGMAAFPGGNSQGTGSNCSSSSGSLIGPKHAMKKSKKDKPAQRVRTVLNESQLKILKQTYNQNQRPDTVTKEQLVEMTGLNPRVIRVWFQNKRCKDKKRQLEHREKLQNQEKEQALHGVRVSGIGPLTVSSPSPVLDSTTLQGANLFPNSVEIRQIPQNPGLWGSNNGQIGGMDGNGGIGHHPPMDTTSFQHPGALAIMPSGISPELMHGAMLPPIPMFPQHAISE